MGAHRGRKFFPELSKGHSNQGSEPCFTEVQQPAKAALSLLEAFSLQCEARGWVTAAHMTQTRLCLSSPHFLPKAV